jgi:hypothetical protein
VGTKVRMILENAKKSEKCLCGVRCVEYRQQIPPLRGAGGCNHLKMTKNQRKKKLELNRIKIVRFLNKDIIQALNDVLRILEK